MASVLEGLAAARPGLRVDFWSKREHVGLLSGKDYLGDFHGLEGPLVPSLLHENTWENATLPDFLTRADGVLIFGQSGTRILAERLTARLKGRADWVRSFPTGDEPIIHASDFVRKQLIRLGWQVPGQTPRVIPPEEETAASEDLLAYFGVSAPPVLIHPGSGGKKKVWPLRNWQALIHWMRCAGRIPVLLSIGPADEGGDDFAQAMQGEGVRVVRGLSILRLAALISLCRCYLGSDSGVSHLAAAVGVPAVVVFGPTNPAVWAPRGKDVRIVRRNWSESDVFDWRPGPPGPPDAGLVEVVSGIGCGL